MEPLKLVERTPAESVALWLRTSVMGEREYVRWGKRNKVDRFFFLLNQLAKNSNTFIVGEAVGLLFAGFCSTLEQIILGMMG